MCEFCTEHGEGKVWYKNAANYSQDLLADIRRKKFIENFLDSTIRDGFAVLGRLETLYRKKGRIHGSVLRKMEQQAKVEHFGQVLPIEEISALVLKSRTIVRMPCACRWTAEKREFRCCYAISYGPEAWYKDLDMRSFGYASDEGLESLSPETAIAQMQEMEEQGLIHTIWTMVTPFIGAVCNCTARECMAMRSLRIGAQTMARAEFSAVVDNALCTGCGLCAEACQFGAIESVHANGSDMARVDTSRCFGCGLCRNSCPSGALSLIDR